MICLEEPVNNLPIGVFDSGVGGLTVLSKLRDLLPNESFIYIADLKNCPYGVKPTEDIKKIVIGVAKKLEEMNVKLIVVACNTASLFLDDIKKSVHIPVIGVIDITCGAALEENKKNYGVIATNATISNERYQSILINSSKNCQAVPSSILVDLVENHLKDVKYKEKIIKQIIDKFDKNHLEVLILGCTHFEILLEEIKKELKETIIITSSSPVAKFMLNYLHTNLIESENRLFIKLYTTGDVNEFHEKANIFGFGNCEVSHVR